MDRVRIRMAGVPHRLGNYEESLGKPPQSLSHFFTLWASVKDAIFGARPLVYLAWILIVIATSWLLAPSGPRMTLLLALVTLSLMAEFAICMLDGADGGRHLILFNFLLDLLFCCDVVVAVRKRLACTPRHWAIFLASSLLLHVSDAGNFNEAGQFRQMGLAQSGWKNIQVQLTLAGNEQFGRTPPPSSNKYMMGRLSAVENQFR